MILGSIPNPSPEVKWPGCETEIPIVWGVVGFAAVAPHNLTVSDAALSSPPPENANLPLAPSRLGAPRSWLGLGMPFPEGCYATRRYRRMRMIPTVSAGNARRPTNRSAQASILAHPDCVILRHPSPTLRSIPCANTCHSA